MEVFVAMPTNGTPYPETMFNIFYQDCREYVDINFSMYSLAIRKPVHIARNELLQKFIKETNADYIWFCDDDNPPSIEVLRKLLNSNKDICSAVVPLRMGDNEGDLLNIFYYDENGGRQHYTDISTCETQVIEVANCGTGCVLISRDVAEDILKAHENPFAFETWEYVVRKTGEVEKYTGQEYESNRQDTYKEDLNGGIVIVKIPLSEDVCFFEKVKELGYKLYADVSAECYHFNSRPIKRKIMKHFIANETNA